MNMTAGNTWQVVSTIQSDTWDEDNIDTTSALCGPVMTIYVGPTRLPFMVHMKVMCSQSLFFFTRFENFNPIPGKDLMLHFPLIDSGDMALFTDCAYSLYWKDYEYEPNTAAGEELVSHVRLYLIAVAFKAEAMQKRTLRTVGAQLRKENDSWIRSLEKEEFVEHFSIRMGLIKLLYDSTKPERDRMRVLFVESMAVHCDEYYVCSAKCEFQIDVELDIFFAAVPAYADDMSEFLRERKEQRALTLRILTGGNDKSDDSEDLEKDACSHEGISE